MKRSLLHHLSHNTHRALHAPHHTHHYPNPISQSAHRTTHGALISATHIKNQEATIDLDYGLQGLTWLLHAFMLRSNSSIFLMMRLSDSALVSNSSRRFNFVFKGETHPRWCLHNLTKNRTGRYCNLKFRNCVLLLYVKEWLQDDICTYLHVGNVDAVLTTSLRWTGCPPSV